MGNCQAAEAATVMIQHPDGKIERVYWSISASHVMASNPGHYVAVIITARDPSSKVVTGEASREAGGSHPAVKHLKLLRPDDTLLMGQVYLLVSFEEVVKKFETKRHAKLSLLVEKSGKKERSSSRNRGNVQDTNEKRSSGNEKDEDEPENALQLADIIHKGREEDEETEELVSVAQALLRRRPNQWRPALNTISEVVGTST